MKVLLSCVVCVLYLVTVGVKHVAAAAGPPRVVDRALRAASARYGVPYWQMRAVAWCESRFNPAAKNPDAVADGEHSEGLMQFLPSTFRGTPYHGYSIFNAWASAMAAAWLVRRDGGWWEWSCRP